MKALSLLSLAASFSRSWCEGRRRIRGTDVLDVPLLSVRRALREGLIMQTRILLAGLAAALVLALPAQLSGHEICLAQSKNGYNGSVPCAGPPLLFDNSWIGYSIREGPPCEDGFPF